ncbi:putative adipophilin/perilipin [Ixodes scapularis]
MNLQVPQVGGVTRSVRYSIAGAMGGDGRQSVCLIPFAADRKTLPSKVLVVSNNATNQIVALVTERSKLARSLQETYAKISPELNKRLAPIRRLATDALLEVYTKVKYVTDGCGRAVLAALGYLPTATRNQPRRENDSNNVQDQKKTDGECSSSSCSESD